MAPERLLVIDDEVDFGSFLRRVAQRLHFEVEVTSQPEAFKEAYGRFQPTVVALDVVMPEADGIELIRWLAGMQCKARIVIISGFDPNYARAAETLGSIGGLSSITRLQKPVSIADLERAFRGAGAETGPTAADSRSG